MKLHSLLLLPMCVALAECSSHNSAPPSTASDSLATEDNAIFMGTDLNPSDSRAASVKTPYNDTDAAAPAIRSQRLVPLGVGADGFPKVKRYFKGQGNDQILEKVETDFNGDGRVDMIQWYDSSGKYVEKEAADFNGRGKLSITSYYKNVLGSAPEIVKQEIDARFEGQPSVWKYFKDGKLVRRDIDRKGTGQPNYWEYYENSKLVRIEKDENSDGIPDSQPTFNPVVKPQRLENTLIPATNAR